MTERKLATIQTIKKTLPIQEADRVELATFENVEWRCIVKKGEFRVGDKAVYFEIDSLLPVNNTFEFLAKGSKPKKTSLEDGTEVQGYHLKTMRMRGVLSQGLALPLNILENFHKSRDTFGMPMIMTSHNEWSDGQDVSEYIGVHKYEPTISTQLAGQVKGNFPSFFPKTREERIQNCFKQIKKYQDITWYATIKYDGASMSVYNYNGDFGACSKNLDLKETKENTIWQLANRYNLKEKLPEGFAVQGEAFGEGIQKNHHKIKGTDFKVFNVYDIKKGEYLDYEKAVQFTNNIGLSFVDIFHPKKDKEYYSLENYSLQDFLDLADSTGLEGLVFRPTVKINDAFERVSFKVISNNYLLKSGG